MSALSPPQAMESSIVPAVPIARRTRLRVARMVTASHDLHLRIAAQFVQLSSRFESTIILAKGRHHVDGKSILGVLMLGAVRGTRLRIVAHGRDAEVAIRALAQLFHPVARRSS